MHERKNIFDNDEFDVFAKGSNIDKSRIHYGKKDKGKVGHWTADAEEDVEKLRLLYNRYGLGAEDTDNELMLLRGMLLVTVSATFISIMSIYYYYQMCFLLIVLTKEIC